MDEHWLEDDPFVDPADQAAVDRERRRQEREARRQRAAGAEPPAPEAPAQPQPFPQPQPSPQPPPHRAEPAGGVAAAKRASRPRNAPRSSLPRRPGRRGGPPKSGLRWLAAALLVGVVVAFAWFALALIQPFHGDGGNRVNVVIPDGAGIGEIGDLLEDRGVIADSRLFQVRVTLAGKRSEMYPGAYTLQEDMSYSDAIAALTTLPVERTITVTLPEGYNREQVAETVADAGLPGNYMKATVKSRLLDPADYGGKGAKNLEGFLFPATYELAADAGVPSLVNHQLRAFKDRLAGIGMRKARSKNLTVFDVVTIASMIEREVSVPKERRLVASVIYNRLSQGIPLGIDATTRFAVGNFTEPLTQSQLASQSPYNTRVHAGLPPGPIGNPGEDSIRAAANPANTDYLYYVVKPGTCGEHAFSSNSDQFERDVAAYNEAREAAGGKSPTTCP